MASTKKRLVEVKNEEGSVFLAYTTMTDENIIGTVQDLNGNYPADSDYEEKCILFAEENGMYFERVYSEEVNV